MIIHLLLFAGREAPVPLQNIEFKARDKPNLGNKKTCFIEEGIRLLNKFELKQKK